jgi:hypothetical protein
MGPVPLESGKNKKHDPAHEETARQEEIREELSGLMSLML